MNTPRADERDWQAQERSLSAPQDGRDALLARALRSQPVPQPPPGFAADVARLAALRATRRVEDDARLERLLQPALFAILVVGALVSALVFGDRVWATTVDAFGAGAVQWLLVGAACVALSAIPAMAQRLSSWRDAAPASA
ncbi:MAG: hypothetical protein NVV60_14635 [Luteimonas sp.]|nr:hypothetical protein [Luteimonas sp.]